MPLPMPRPISGSRLAPKISTTIKRMTSISGKPIRPMTYSLFRDLSIKGPACAGYRRAAATLVALLGVAASVGPGDAGIARAAGPQFASGVNLVEVYVTVTDH